jgi:8-oxo-dGTP diphosphatase
VRLGTVGGVDDSPPSSATSPAEPVRRQRLAAYALCRRGDEVLLARYSDRAPHPGRWALPGGGVDHGEHPRDAVAREVHEETGLVVSVGRLVDVTSVHFTGRAPSGTWEDYHSVGLVFEATTEDASTPRVLEVDGTTDAAAWVPLAAVREGGLELSDAVRRLPAPLA